MLRQLSRLIGLYFGCYCLPLSNAGLTMHNSLLNAYVFKTYVGLRQDRYALLLYFFATGEICKLNNSGLKDPYNNADNRLIRNTGWIYHEIDECITGEYTTLGAIIATHCTSGPS